MIFDYSQYAYSEEIKHGYVTTEEGNRIGFGGEIILENKNIRTVKNISFLCIRIQHEIKGCAEKIIQYIRNGYSIYNTLILSPPGGGKTTLLRDTIRILSNLNMQVCIIDERSEIAACYNGIPKNDIGIMTDVIDSCPKAAGIDMAIRSLSPSIIAVDELGGNEDTEAVVNAIYSGVKVIATMHGDSINNRCKNILFERYILLEGGKNTGQIKHIYDRNSNIIDC